MTSARRTAAALLLAGLSTALFPGCAPNGGHDGHEVAADVPSGHGEAREYAVRGLVRGVQGRELTVAHEPVPDLVGPTGEVDPMGAMTMTFLLAESIDPQSLSTGDKIAFTLAIDWSADEPARVTAVETLPADTELTLR